MNKMMKKFLVTSLAAVSLVTVGAGVAAVPANADVATTSMVTRLTGAAARVTTEDSGLRFFAKIDREQYGAAAAAGEVKVGMIIVPVEYVAEAGGYTHEALIAKYTAEGIIDVSYDETQVADYELYAASIINIKDANYTREFTAIPYISVDGAYSYGTADVTGEDYVRSVYEVASKAYVSENETAETKAVLKGYLDGVVDIKNENGVVSIANNTADYTSPYVVTEKAEGVWEVRPTQENALKTNRINAKSMLYNGARKTDFHVVDGETEIHTLVTGGNDADASGHERTKFNEDGSVGLKAQQSGVATASVATLGDHSASYIAFKGEYGPNTYMDFYFKGNNMPNVMFYVDEVNGILTKEGGNGLLFMNGIMAKVSDNISFDMDTLKVFGPHRLTGSTYQIPYQLVNGATVGAMLNLKGSAMSQAYLSEYADTEFKYTVGTFESGGALFMDLSLYAKVEGNYELVEQQMRALPGYSDNASVYNVHTAKEWGTGSIMVTSTYSDSISNGNAYTTFDCSGPYTYKPTEINSGITKNADGSVSVASGQRLASVGYVINGWGSGVSNYYNNFVTADTSYKVGEFFDITFTGNNMPQVMLFANNISPIITAGNASYTDDIVNQKGFLLANGFYYNTSTMWNNTLKVFGPNRINANLANETTTNITYTEGKEYTSLAADVNYKYVVGTYENAAGVVVISVELYNADTNELLVQGEYATGLTKANAEAQGSNVLFYAGVKGPSVTATTFKYGEAYEKVIETPAEIVSRGATENADGSVTLAGGDDTTGLSYTGLWQGVGYASGAGTLQNNYVGFAGDYGVGTYVTTQFKGDNMPQVTLFANAINEWVAAGHATSGSAPLGQTGYLITNKIVYFSGTILTAMDFLYCHGPNRISQNINVATVSNFTNPETATLAFDENETYTYVVGSYEGADGKVMIEVAVYAADGAVVYSGEYATGKTVAEVEAYGTNIILFAGIKGCPAGAEERKTPYSTTFYYVDPMSKEPTYAEAVAKINAKKK